MATALARANPLEGLPPTSPMLTFNLSSPSGGWSFSVGSLALVVGGIVIGLVIAMLVMMAMSGTH